MTRCCVSGCGSSKYKNKGEISLHRLPSNNHIKKKWLEIIGKENLKNNKEILICSLHFEEECFKRTPYKIKLHHDALPSKRLLPFTTTSHTLKEQQKYTILDKDTSFPSINKEHEELYNITSPHEALNPLPRISGLQPLTTTSHTLKEQQKYSILDKDTSFPSINKEHEESYNITSPHEALNPLPIISGLQINKAHEESYNITSPHEALNPLPSISGLQPLTIISHTLKEQQKYNILNEDTSYPSIIKKHEESHIITSSYEALNPLARISGFQAYEQEKLIKKLAVKCKCQKNKIKRLNETIRRQKKKIANCTVIIAQLREKEIISRDSCILLEECAGPEDFLKRQVLKHRGLPLEKQYSEDVRKFALTLNFLSPKGYDYVRKTFNTCLPHPRTLSKWYQKVNAEPGFTKEAFDTLKFKVQNSDGPVICALSFDEMSIRKSLCWDPSTNKYFGRVDTGTLLESDCVDEANQFLVFLLTCINGSWKIPVGYFLITTLTGEQKARLVEMCIKMCEDVGIKVVSITCDGPAANFSMFEALGCELTKQQNITSLKISESLVHVFLDPCHAIKLIRNAFGELKIFKDTQGREINYKYVEMLLKLQETEGIHLANRLTKAHVDFGKQKMKVKLATQLLSTSVADALETCKEDLKLVEFKDCHATANFIRLINDVFDILNSRSIRPPGWKKAICKQNIGLVEAFLDGASEYVKNLKLPNGKLVIHSQRKTGFIGILIDINSALDMYKRLTQKCWLVYLPLYKISQDHLELFFSSIRARGGFNNNPNAVQLRAAYKRLLVRAEIRDGGMGNCIPLEQINILTCSSKIEPTTTINNLTDRNSYVAVQEDDSNLYEEYLENMLINSEYTNTVVTYIAGFVSKKIAKVIKCETCHGLLFGDQTTYPNSLIRRKTFGGLCYPSKDVVDIVKKTENILKSNLRKHRPEDYLYSNL